MSDAAPPGPAIHPIGLVVTDDLRRSRLTVFFRVLLVIPHLIWLELWGIGACVVASRATVFFRIFLALPALILVYVFRLVNSVIAVLGWFYALATGQMNEGMRNISSWLVGYETQTYGYLLLLTGRYPSLEGTPSA